LIDNRGELGETVRETVKPRLGARCGQQNPSYLRGEVGLGQRNGFVADYLEHDIESVGRDLRERILRQTENDLERDKETYEDS